jgi:ubiquinone/menaquinone biosynthesis C-methylase UbiE
MPYKELILSNKKTTKYVGLDIDSGLNYNEVKPDVLWNGVTMPFENNVFDVVMSTEVLEHILNPDNYLLEVKRVLKPGGFFFFTVPFLMSLHEVHMTYILTLEKFLKSWFLRYKNSDGITPHGSYGFMANISVSKKKNEE